MQKKIAILSAPTRPTPTPKSKFRRGSSTSRRPAETHKSTAESTGEPEREYAAACCIVLWWVKDILQFQI